MGYRFILLGAHKGVLLGLLKASSVSPGALLGEHEGSWQAQAAAVPPSGGWVPQGAHAETGAAHAIQGLAQRGPGLPAVHPYGAALAAGGTDLGNQFAAPSLDRGGAAGGLWAANPVSNPIMSTAAPAPGAFAGLVQRGQQAQQSGQSPATGTAAPTLAGGFIGAAHPAAAPGTTGSALLSSLGAPPPPPWPARAVPSLGQSAAAVSSGQHGAAARRAAACGAGQGPDAAPGEALQQAQPAGAMPGFSQAAAPGASQAGCQQL